MSGRKAKCPKCRRLIHTTRSYIRRATVLCAHGPGKRTFFCEGSGMTVKREATR